MNKINVLYVGDSEIVVSKYLVGADSFEQANFNDNSRFFREAVATLGYVDIKHVNPHDVPLYFPKIVDELADFDVVIFNDVGYNSMIFYPGLKPPYEYPLGPDRISLVKEFVEKVVGSL